MNDDDLKPCPFCGHEAPESMYDDMAGYLYVKCHQCGVCAFPSDTIEELIAKWNRRTNGGDK